MAGSGGHDVPANVDACIFDLAKANGSPHNANGMPNRAVRLFPGELSSGDIVGAIRHSPACPSIQAYATSCSSQGGGPRGRIYATRSAQGTTGNAAGLGGAYAMNLDTGLWIRRSTNVV